MLCFRYCAARLYFCLPTLSAGYTAIAKPSLLPDGSFIRAASHINDRDAAHETSRVLRILKCQVNIPLACGLVTGLPTSFAVIILTVLSLFAAAANRFICVAVKTCCGFCRSPLAATIISAGSVME